MPNAQTKESIAIVQRALSNVSDRSVIYEVFAEDAPYVSINSTDEDLKRILPHTGTAYGPEGFLSVFKSVQELWEMEEFEIEEAFGEGERVAMFGRFVYRSLSLGHRAESTFAIFARVRDSKIVHFQFHEDSFAAARSFRSGGTWTIETPGRAPIEV